MDEKRQDMPNEARQAAGSNAADTQVIPVLQEQVTVGKRVVETGKVQISKTVTEDQTSVSIPLTREEYDVERIPVNQVVETPPPALRYEGDTAIIPVLREVLVVLDGFDELLQATGVSQTRYLTLISEFQQELQDMGRPAVFVVTSDPDIARAAAGAGAEVVAEIRPLGMNRAAVLGRRHALSSRPR